MIVENLLQFGLDEKEVSVYLGLISLGPSTVSDISKHSGVNRGTTYDILERLRAEGLVCFYKEYRKDSKIQKFVAEPPQKLVSAIEGKKRNLDTLKLHISKSLPELESLYEKSGARPVAKYYEGSVGLRIILQDVLSSFAPSPGPGRVGERSNVNSAYFVYSSANIKDYLYKTYPNFNRDRIKAGIKNRVIAFEQGGQLAGLDERKCLPREHSAPSYIIIYSGKVAMISLTATEEPVGVVIEDRALYTTQAMIFQKLWETL